MEIKAAQVKELREMSGVAMMECKRALVDCDGDIEKALDLLRSNSALKAEKKATRVAAEGVLRTFAGDSHATLVEINSETDFAAKDANFIKFTDDVCEYISVNKVNNILEVQESEVEDKRKNLIQSIGTRTHAAIEMWRGQTQQSSNISTDGWHNLGSTSHFKT